MSSSFIGLTVSFCDYLTRNSHMGMMFIGTYVDMVDIRPYEKT